MELIINNLSKTYANGVQALQDISLEIPNGMFGFDTCITQSLMAPFPNGISLRNLSFVELLSENK